jgi:hypothetical protein
MVMETENSNIEEGRSEFPEVPEEAIVKPNFFFFWPSFSL